MKRKLTDAGVTAERRVAAAHDLLTHATRALWATQPRADLVAFVRDTSDVFGVARLSSSDDATASALVSVARAGVARARFELDAAFDALAAERSSESPVALVRRELTAEEAAELAAAEHRLRVARDARDDAADGVDYFLDERVRRGPGRQGYIDHRLAEWREARDRHAAEADAALDARAPLLAAQWEAP